MVLEVRDQFTLHVDGPARWAGLSTQREAHFRDGERVLVALETLLPVVPETWGRDMEQS